MESVECPICGLLFPKFDISAHADRCLDKTDIDDDEFASDVSLSSDSKQPRVEQATDLTVLARCSSPIFGDLSLPSVKAKGTAASAAPSTDCDRLCHSSAQSVPPAGVCQSTSKSQNVKPNGNQTLKRTAKSAKLLDFFTGSQKSVQPKETKLSGDSVKSTAPNPSSLQSDILRVKSVEESMKTEAAGEAPDTMLCGNLQAKESTSAVASVSHSFTGKMSTQSSTVSTYVPLAERMRPTVLADFVGQGQVVGSQRPLRSLLESTSVVSMILWGPPGCGKVIFYLLYHSHCSLNF